MKYHLGYIPVNLIQFAINNRLISPFRTFLYLKYQFNSGFELEKYRAGILKDLGICDRTLQNHLKKLRKVNMIGIARNGYVFVRGFEFIRLSKNLKYGRRVEFTINDLSKSKFTAYLVGAYAGMLAYVYIKMLKKQREGRKYRDNCPQQSRSTSSGILAKLSKTEQNIEGKMMSYRFLIKHLKRSKSWIGKQIKLAVKYKYLYVKENIKLTLDNARLVKHFIKVRLPGEPFPVNVHGLLAFRDANGYTALLRLYKPE